MNKILLSEISYDFSWDSMETEVVVRRNGTTLTVEGKDWATPVFLHVYNVKKGTKQAEIDAFLKARYGLTAYPPPSSVPSTTKTVHSLWGGRFSFIRPTKTTQPPHTITHPTLSAPRARPSLTFCPVIAKKKFRSAELSRVTEFRVK